ncbi:MAG: GNAT family N-acetyltransferase [Gemmatimonadaceae bacterium]|nr:GNAT family N-acetyltransferase [Gemmatimonadaceae bacterium]
MQRRIEQGQSFSTAGGSPDWQPTLTGTQVTLRPLEAGDFEPLYAVASDPAIWEQHPEPTRWQREVFSKFFTSGLALNGTPAGGTVVVHDTVSGAVIGCSRWYDWNSETREVAIGYTFLARSHWGGTFNRELKALMLRHAFEHATRVWFHVGPNNMRSQQALKRIGARYSHTVIAEPGQGRDTAWFEMNTTDFAAHFP